MSALGQADLDALVQNPTPEVRSQVVHKVARYFDAAAADGDNDETALDILRIMARDESIRVRQSLSQGVCQTPRLPHDVAIKLAKDLEVVALPVISHSPVLDDDDLIVVVDQGSPPKQVAVAGRKIVSDRVAGRIAHTHNQEAVVTLVENPGAVIREETFGVIIDDFGDLITVQQPIANRTSLPPNTAERLMQLTDDELSSLIARRQKLGTEFNGYDPYYQGNPEISAGPSAAALARSVYEDGKLTPLILLRAACQGDIAFVSEGFALLAKMEPKIVNTLLLDRGWIGLRGLFAAANIEHRYFNAFQTAMEGFFEVGAVNPRARNRHAKNIVARFLTQREMLPTDEFDEFIKLMSNVNQPITGSLRGNQDKVH